MIDGCLVGGEQPVGVSEIATDARHLVHVVGAPGAVLVLASGLGRDLQWHELLVSLNASTLTALSAGQCTVTATSPGSATLRPDTNNYTVTITSPPKKKKRS